MTSAPPRCHTSLVQARYKIMMGRPQEWGHHVEGEFFSGAEASWQSPMVGR